MLDGWLVEGRTLALYRGARARGSPACESQLSTSSSWCVLARTDIATPMYASILSTNSTVSRSGASHGHSLQARRCRTLNACWVEEARPRRNAGHIVVNHVFPPFMRREAAERGNQIIQVAMNTDTR